MRRMIAISLLLLPVIAHAQASTSAEPKPSASSAILQSKLTQPTRLTETAMAASGPLGSTPAARSAASAASINTVSHTTGNTVSYTAVREFVETRYLQDFAQAALRQGGTLEYTLRGSVPTESSAPTVTKAVEIDLSQQELAAQPAVTDVVVRAMVDEFGIPRNLSVARSAGAVLDQRALAAVSQYRFKPATVDNRPVEAAVTIAIKIQKQ